MARNKPPQALRPRADDQAPEWDDAVWDHDHDEAAHHRARQLLSQQNAGLHRLGGAPGWPGGRWVKRIVAVVAVLLLVSAVGFGTLWWRLGAGPINFDMATPWLAEAIQDNIGEGNSVEVGGTQIERTGRIRIAVRIRDIVVRDRDHAIVASAPKAEVRLSVPAMLMGRLRAESLNLVDAVLAVRIMPDGQVTVSTGDNARPLATGVASTRPTALPVPVPTGPSLSLPPGQVAPLVQALPTPPAAAADKREPVSGLLAGLDWLDSLSLTGLDGQNLNEIGLKNGRLVVDDQQRGNTSTFNNITLSLRRPTAGGVAMSVGEAGKTPWSLGVVVGAPANGVRSVDIRADKLPSQNILLALRMKDLTYSADLPLTGELKGELGRDGLPTYFRGKITAAAGNIIDNDTPDYPMPIDSAEVNLEWDSGRRVLLAPFKVISGNNRVTMLAHVEPPNDAISNWQAGLSGGTIVLAGTAGEAPLIFNRIDIALRFDTDNKRMMLTQANISNGEIGIAGSGSVDYAGEPRLTLGIAGTPMSASALKRMWPVLITPEVREWVIERVERGSLQRLDIAVNSPVRNLSRRGPPIPDDGLSVTIAANGVTLRPVDDLPVIRDADLRARVTGRTATVTIGQSGMDTAGGRKLNLNDIVFEVPDMVPKPMPARVKFRIDGTVPAVAEILASDRLSEFTGNMLDPATSKGNASAFITLGMPIKGELTKTDTSYTINADLTNFSADKIVMGQKLEANALKITANNQGYQVKGDVKINGQAASIDYRKPTDADADIRAQTTLDDAGRARLGFDLGPAVTGAIPVKVIGKIGSGDRETKLGIDADLTALKLDNILPGWVKAPGKGGRAVFNMVQKAQSTRLEDIVVDGGGVAIKGSVEVDPNGDLVNANFPTYSPSEGDKTSLKAERSPDGVLKVTMRGDVFDGRGFLKSAISGKESDSKSKPKTIDFDIDVKLGAVAGFYGEAVRSLDAKVSRRAGTIKTFNLSGKLGRDTPLTGDMRGRAQGAARDVIYIETNDAGAFFRVTDTYSKMVGGQLSLAMDTPSSDTRPKEGLINVRDFAIKGEASLDRVAAGGPGVSQGGIGFSRLRAEFTRQNGQLTIREGVVKGPSIGATIEGSIDYPANTVRMSGTFVPMYGLNNMFGQLPVIGLFLGGGSNEGLIGITYEVVGTPGQPVLRVNPISAIAPGVLRNIFKFDTGKPNGPVEFPSSPNNSN